MVFKQKIIMIKRNITIYFKKFLFKSKFLINFIEYNLFHILMNLFNMLEKIK